MGMHLRRSAMPLVVAALIVACVEDRTVGGRRDELPFAGDAGGAAGTGAGGVGLSGSSDSGKPDRADGPALASCPGADAGYPVETGIPCVTLFEPETPCLREDGVQCV